MSDPFGEHDLAGRPTGRWRALTLLAITLVLSMSPWFSASAVVPQLRAEWDLSDGAAAWLTIAVQLGFVRGAGLEPPEPLRRRPAKARDPRGIHRGRGRQRDAAGRRRRGRRDTAALRARLLPGGRLPARPQAGGALVPQGPRHRARDLGRGADRGIGYAAARERARRAGL